MSLFIGVAGAALVLLALIRADLRRDWPIYAAIVATLMLALGKYTPLLYFLYQCVPGFDMFRGYSKFIFQVSLFLALLAGLGFDSLRARPAPLLLAAGFVILGAFLIARASIVSSIPQADWNSFLEALGKPDNYLNFTVAGKKAEFQINSHSCATISLIVAAASCLCVSLILAATRKTPRAQWLLLGFAVAESLAFAGSVLSTFSMKDLCIGSLQSILDPKANDERILILTNPNATMLLQRETCWGDDPSVLRRYAEFVAWVNGLDPDQASQSQSFFRNDKRSSLMRLSGAYLFKDDKWTKSPSRYPILPRVFLVGRWHVARDRNEIFGIIARGPFDPWKEVLLEQPSGLGSIAPNDASPGDARVLEKTDDSLVIEATVVNPAILVVSDAYSKGWRARPLAPGPQSEYNVMPANYWMRGIPLKPGKHKLILEYMPRAFVIGAWLSALALALYAGAWVFIRRRPRSAIHESRSAVNS